MLMLLIKKCIAEVFSSSHSSRYLLWIVSLSEEDPYRPPTDRSSNKKSTIFSSSYLKLTIVSHWSAFETITQNCEYRIKNFFWTWRNFSFIIVVSALFLTKPFLLKIIMERKKILENVLNIPLFLPNIVLKPQKVNFPLKSNSRLPLSSALHIIVHFLKKNFCSNRFQSNGFSMNTKMYI